MKRKIELAGSVVLILSFFLPWIKSIEMISSLPVSGFNFLLISLVMGMMGTSRGILSSLPFLLTGVAMIAILVMCLLLIVKTRVKHSRLQIGIFCISLGAFLLQMITAVVEGMKLGKSLFVSLSYQFSFVCYGVYVALMAAALLFVMSQVGAKRNQS